MKGFNHFYFTKGVSTTKQNEANIKNSPLVKVRDVYVKIPAVDPRILAGFNDIEDVPEILLGDTANPSQDDQTRTVSCVVDKDAQYEMFLWDAKHQSFIHNPDNPTMSGRQLMLHMLEDACTNMGRTPFTKGVNVVEADQEDAIDRLRSDFWDSKNYVTSPDNFKREYVPVTKMCDNYSAVVDVTMSPKSDDVCTKCNLKCVHKVDVNGTTYVKPVTSVTFSDNGVHNTVIPMLKREIDANGCVMNRYMATENKDSFIKSIRSQYDQKKAAQRANQLSSVFDFDKSDPKSAVYDHSDSDTDYFERM